MKRSDSFAVILGLLAVLALSEGLSSVQVISGALLFASVWLLLAEKHAHPHWPDLHHRHSHQAED
mgnify:CR=1 FL=1